MLLSFPSSRSSGRVLSLAALAFWDERLDASEIFWTGLACGAAGMPKPDPEKLEVDENEPEEPVELVPAALGVNENGGLFATSAPFFAVPALRNGVADFDPNPNMLEVLPSFAE